jgi:PRC-barrel domain
MTTTLPSHETARSWPGLSLLDRDGDTVGRITHIYLDRDSGQPEWALVAVPERGRVFVPLIDARAADDRVQVVVAKAAVREAPKVASSRELSQEDETRLYRHYGVPDGAADQGQGARRAPPSGGRAKGAADRLNQLAGGAANRARRVATSAPARRVLSAAGVASALGAAAALAARSGQRRRGGLAGALDGLVAVPAAAWRRRRRRRMAGNLKLAVGLATGYVLGAKAGRERYERLRDAARQVADRPERARSAGSASPDDDRPRAGEARVTNEASQAGEEVEQPEPSRAKVRR